MKQLKMSNDLFVSDLASGTGSIKYYDYFVSGLKIKTKSAVYEAIKLKISKIGRVDKITHKFSYFNYETMRFE